MVKLNMPNFDKREKKCFFFTKGADFFYQRQNTLASLWPDYLGKSWQHLGGREPDLLLPHGGGQPLARHAAGGHRQPAHPVCQPLCCFLPGHHWTGPGGPLPQLWAQCDQRAEHAGAVDHRRGDQYGVRRTHPGVSGISLTNYKHSLFELTHCNENPIYVFPEQELCAASVPISTFMCLWGIYIFQLSVCLFCCRKICGPILGIKNRSQTHECRNWDWGRAIPFLGIYVSNFRYCVFALHNLQLT